MRALIAHTGRAAHRLARCLTKAGWEVVVLAATDDLAVGLDADDLQVAFVDGSREDLLEQLPDLALLPTPPHAIVVLRDTRGPAVARAFELGADDVMPSTASGSEILARAAAPQRFKRRHGLLPVDTTALDGLRAWRELGATLTRAVAAVIDTPLRRASHIEAPAVGYAAELTMALPTERLRLTLGVGLRERHAAGLVERLFGDIPIDHAAPDVCRELANTVGGAVKQVALTEDVEFSAGLPVDVAHTSGRPLRVWRLRGGDVRLWAWAAVSDLRPRRVRTEQLRERMVLAEDAVNGRGALLVPKGRTLTADTVARLNAALGGTHLLEVIDVDAA